MVVMQFEVYYVALDPTMGSEIQKTRPCMVISPDVMNRSLNTVFIIPLTSTIRAYPTRVNCNFNKKNGQLAVDQLRAVDKVRLVKRLGAISDKKVLAETLDLLQEIFSF